MLIPISDKEKAIIKRAFKKKGELTLEDCKKIHSKFTSVVAEVQVRGYAAYLKMQALKVKPEVAMPDSKIKYHYITTKAGNSLSIFYNPENDLFCVDLTHKNEKGGNELVRMTLDESKLLKHVK